MTTFSRRAELRWDGELMTGYGIGLRSVIGRRGGQAQRVMVEAIINAEKGADGIQIQTSHLVGVVEGLQKIDDVQLRGIAREVAEGCTISMALRGAVRITHEVSARCRREQRGHQRLSRCL